MKIVIDQKDGLGNQLFQYAAGLYFAKKYRASLEIAREPEHQAASFGHPRPFLLSNFCISLGVRFCFRYALRATLQQNRAPSTSTSHGVGQNKPPKWAKPSCQTQADATIQEINGKFWMFATVFNGKYSNAISFVRSFLMRSTGYGQSILAIP